MHLTLEVTLLTSHFRCHTFPIHYAHSMFFNSFKRIIQKKQKPQAAAVGVHFSGAPLRRGPSSPAGIPPGPPTGPHSSSDRLPQENESLSVPVQKRTTLSHSVGSTRFAYLALYVLFLFLLFRAFSVVVFGNH
ncbi:hypothetical protein CEXT_776811 [Caerostris extrusa]|uniref:Uncharacterized protein n=1 Tax=Caerostris extrusa TaxID=172846 RepID=A0AAV4WFS6_CAEEX|nr:hypothetical protein CEXT_776811 [Caerostris extrusa]